MEEDRVRKRFAHADKASAAARELRQLNEIFNFREYRGYRHQAVGLIAFDAEHRIVVMERAAGVPLSGLALDRFNCRLVGHWIALFHNGGDSERPEKQVPRFGDFGPVHLFIDHDRKMVTAIDPAASVGTLTDREEDVANMCVALVVHALKRGTWPTTAVTGFLEGYRDVAPGLLQVGRLEQHLEAPLEQTRCRWIRKGGAARVIARGTFAPFAAFTRKTVIRAWQATHGVKSCNI